MRFVSERHNTRKIISTAFIFTRTWISSFTWTVFYVLCSLLIPYFHSVHPLLYLSFVPYLFSLIFPFLLASFISASASSFSLLLLLPSLSDSFSHNFSLLFLFLFLSLFLPPVPFLLLYVYCPFHFWFLISFLLSSFQSFSFFLSLRRDNIRSL